MGQRTREAHEEASNYLKNEVEHGSVHVPGAGRERKMCGEEVRHCCLYPVTETAVGGRETGRVSLTGVRGHPRTQQLTPDFPARISGKPECPQRNWLLGKVFSMAQGGQLEVAADVSRRPKRPRPLHLLQSEECCFRDGEASSHQAPGSRILLCLSQEHRQTTPPPNHSPKQWALQWWSW